MSNNVIVNRQNWLTKNQIQSDTVNWVLDPYFFDEEKQNFGLYGLAGKYFLPEFTGDAVLHTVQQWETINNFKIYPDNGGVMVTPVIWFKNQVKFNIDDPAAVQIDLDNSSRIMWILAAFASAALIARNK